MGQPRKRRLIFVITLFLVTGILVNSKPVSRSTPKAEPLVHALSRLNDGWQQGNPITLDEKMIKALSLDDYIFQQYVKEDEVVTLYIGYYLTSGKIGAAHDPLVCFPGQGWRISKEEKGTLVVDSSLKLTISYSTMLVERDLDKQFTLYWFQTYDRAIANTFSQKRVALMQKIFAQGEDNAFVRISCSTGNREISECKNTVLSFAKALYPSFLDYVRGPEE